MIAPKVEIVPDALYSVEETAEILSFRGANPKSRTNAVYRICPAELARTATGPNGGNYAFRGRDILAYMDSRRKTA